MTVRVLLLLSLAACDRPDYSALPSTRCGLHFDVGANADEIQTAETAIIDSFKSSLDPSLHNVCGALFGWKLAVTSDPILPGPNTNESVDPTSPVFGDANPATMEIKVTSVHLILAHEAAHVAQGCTVESAHHTDWDNTCGSGVCVCTDGRDGTGQWCTLGLVQPQLIEVRARLDQLLGP